MPAGTLRRKADIGSAENTKPPRNFGWLRGPLNHFKIINIQLTHAERRLLTEPRSHRLSYSTRRSFLGIGNDLGGSGIARGPSLYTVEGVGIADLNGRRFGEQQRRLLATRGGGVKLSVECLVRNEPYLPLSKSKARPSQALLSGGPEYRAQISTPYFIDKLNIRVCKVNMKGGTSTSSNIHSAKQNVPASVYERSRVKLSALAYRDCQYPVTRFLQSAKQPASVLKCALVLLNYNLFLSTYFCGKATGDRKLCSPDGI
ncbi:hypothetical protein DENSPDRAFT_870634 [Dentipellis sp. KUC8613]|nr:hypothetical protein DENSPDRAFT_870634 [Dentipellis sp. KUC8613]